MNEYKHDRENLQMNNTPSKRSSPSLVTILSVKEMQIKAAWATAAFHYR